MDRQYSICSCLHNGKGLAWQMLYRLVKMRGNPGNVSTNPLHPANILQRSFSHWQGHFATGHASHDLVSSFMDLFGDSTGSLLRTVGGLVPFPVCYMFPDSPDGFKQ
jgi:hypothetical protein